MRSVKYLEGYVKGKREISATRNILYGHIREEFLKGEYLKGDSHKEGNYLKGC
jgi:hypothetical protein